MPAYLLDSSSITHVTVCSRCGFSLIRLTAFDAVEAARDHEASCVTHPKHDRSDLARRKAEAAEAGVPFTRKPAVRRVKVTECSQSGCANGGQITRGLCAPHYYQLVTKPKAAHAPDLPGLDSLPSR